MPKARWKENGSGVYRVEIEYDPAQTFVLDEELVVKTIFGARVVIPEGSKIAVENLESREKFDPDTFFLGISVLALPEIIREFTEGEELLKNGWKLSFLYADWLKLKTTSFVKNS